MSTTEASIEREIQDKGPTAQRLTPADIDDRISSEVFWQPALDDVPRSGRVSGRLMGDDRGHLNRMTVCLLVLKNGFVVSGESSCVSAENFDAEIGRQVARANARAKIWALEGYLLRECVHHGLVPPVGKLRGPG